MPNSVANKCHRAWQTTHLTGTGPTERQSQISARLGRVTRRTTQNLPRRRQNIFRHRPGVARRVRRVAAEGARLPLSDELLAELTRPARPRPSPPTPTPPTPPPHTTTVLRMLHQIRHASPNDHLVIRVMFPTPGMPADRRRPTRTTMLGRGSASRYGAIVRFRRPKIDSRGLRLTVGGVRKDPTNGDKRQLGSSAFQ